MEGLTSLMLTLRVQVRRPAAYYAPLVKEEVQYIRKVNRNGVSAALPTLAANATFEAERQRSLQQPATSSSAPALDAAPSSSCSFSSSAALASAAATLVCQSRPSTTLCYAAATHPTSMR